jgi:hypothetical protein
MSIFVSIAAYRDPELLPTLRDCLLRARYPDDLYFGICWQHAADEAIPSEFADHRMRVIDVSWQNSQGACWARSEIMKLWDGEDFFLQLDSHHRFVQDWDVLLLSLAEGSGAAKPLLTSYGAPFDPRSAAPENGEPMQMDFDHFTADGIPMFRPRAIPDWRELQRPLRARFVSAHFLFTLGAFVGEVPYDPDLYFHGEEITLAIRAFTRGYTLLHPRQHVLWHEYTRDYRTKHWDDHVQAQGIELEWHARDAVSRGKVCQFLTAPFVGPFGCGTERLFGEYEAYAGLSFAHLVAQDATLQGLEPPNPPVTLNWATQVRDWHVSIVLDRKALPSAALLSSQFWYVGVHDAGDIELYRQDVHSEELAALLTGESAAIVIERTFRSAQQPASWTVWPFSPDDGWLEKSVGTVAGGLTIAAAAE